MNVKLRCIAAVDIVEHITHIISLFRRSPLNMAHALLHFKGSYNAVGNGFHSLEDNGSSVLVLTSQCTDSSFGKRRRGEQAHCLRPFGELGRKELSHVSAE